MMIYTRYNKHLLRSIICTFLKSGRKNATQFYEVHPNLYVRRDLLSKSANQSHEHATCDHRTASLQSTLALQLGIASVAQKVFC